MKRFSLTLTLLAMLTSGLNVQAQLPAGNKKVLVVYFSHSGNTREIANQIKDATGGDIFEIQPVDAYTSVYDDLTKQAKKELESGYKPPLKTKVNNIEQYDVVFVGSPCWWATVAPPVMTFLSDYDLSGKTVVPFMTHEGSGMGRSVSDIKKLCPESTVLKGLPVRGSAVKEAKNDATKWLRELEIIK